jgi:hypothetical protein
MEEEGKNLGIWQVDFDPALSDRERRAYEGVVRRLAELPMESRYNAMAAKPMACIQAVDAWQNLARVFSEYHFESQGMLFNRDVLDHYGYNESGQVMLRVRLPNSDRFLVMDVAGYLFGFSYKDMFVAVGSLDYIQERATDHYAVEYPDLVVRAKKG